MQKIGACLLLCFCFPWPVSALDGQIFGPDSRPLAAASISLIGRAGNAQTNQEGRFQLQPTPEPPFQILVTEADGTVYKPIQILALPENEPLQLHLEMAMNDQLTVLGGLLAGPDAPPAAALSVVARKSIEQDLPKRLADVLRDIPGTGRLDEGASVVPSIRGLARGRTIILLDDGRVTAERRAGPSATFLNPESLDSIEVIRGPGSVAYGSDAFGGVIRARSKRASMDEPASASLSFMGALGVPENSVHAEISAPFLQGGLLFDLHVRQQENYTSPKGEIPNSKAQGFGGRLNYTKTLGNGILDVGFRLDRGRDSGKPDLNFATSKTIYPEENAERLHASYALPSALGFSEIEVGGFLGGYQLILDRERLANGVTTRQIARSDVDAKDYGLRAEAERNFEWGNLKIGLDANGRFGLRAVGHTFKFDLEENPTEIVSELSIDRAARHDVAVFAGLGGQLGAFRLSGGGRLDQVWTKNHQGYFGSQSTSHANISGFAAASWALTQELEFSVQAARGFRDPTLSDRYFRGISGRGFVTGNPMLNPETSRQFDVSARWARERISLAAFAYLYRIENLIERYREGNDFFFRNRGESELKGLEIELDLDLGRRMALRVGAQTARGKTLDDQTPTADIPASQVFLKIQQDKASAWSWMARFALVAKDDLPGPTEIAAPAYTLLDAGLGWRWNPKMSVYFLGSNLLDRAYPATSDESSSLAPGRSLQATVRMGL